ncbi:MAG: glycosyltransferase family 4 protein [Candidatus Muiribacteriota bacterium]
MKKIKILYAVSAGNVGGGESYTLEILKHIDRNKFYTAVAAPKNTIFYKKACKHCDEIHNIPFFDNFDFYSFIKLGMLMKKFDVTHSNLNRACLFGGILGKILKKKCIATMHGIDKVKFYRWNDRIITLSKFQYNIYSKIFGENKTLLLLPGIDIDVNSIKSFNLREKYEISPDELIISVVARLHVLKGHDTIIKTAELLKKDNIKFKMIFIGDGREKRRLQKLSKQRGVDNNIIFLGNVPNSAEILKNNSDIVILPSKKENMPISILEAMTLAIPVIASDVGGINEEIDFSELLVQKFDNPEEFYEKIKLLIYNKELKEKVISHNMNKIKNEFSYEKMLKGLVKIYEEAVDI